MWIREVPTELQGILHRMTGRECRRHQDGPYILRTEGLTGECQRDGTIDPPAATEDGLPESHLLKIITYTHDEGCMHLTHIMRRCQVWDDLLRVCDPVHPHVLLHG